MTEELTVEVQLVGTGLAPATENGGTLMHPVSSVRVRALPGNLPDVLTYDLSSLVDYDATITVADLTPPEGVTIQAEPTEVIARVLAPRVEEEPVVAEAVEGEAAEGGEDAAEGGEAEARATTPRADRRSSSEAARAGSSSPGRAPRLAASGSRLTARSPVA